MGLRKCATGLCFVLYWCNLTRRLYSSFPVLFQRHCGSGTDFAVSLKQPWMTLTMHKVNRLSNMIMKKSKAKPHTHHMRYILHRQMISLRIWLIPSFADILQKTKNWTTTMMFSDNVIIMYRFWRKKTVEIQTSFLSPQVIFALFVFDIR